MQVLVAEDSPLVSKILTQTLSRMENTVVDAVFDGTTASDHLAQKAYDLVLLDWKMPRKDGIDILKEIRESGNEVPVIMVTADSDKENILMAIKAGANDYIIKPFTPAMVIEKIRAILPG